MIRIDGSQGEGGGQILRTSLTLSLLTGKPLQLHSIRAGRKKPGLMRQHLTAVQAAARIGNCPPGGVGIGSTELSFAPKQIQGGSFHFAIGSAGSTMLVLQTLLPALLFAQEPSELVLKGGTHNPMSPPFDFFQRVYAPLLRRMGAKLDCQLLRPGFFPAGGGAVRLSITPIEKLQPIEILERGKLLQRKATVHAAHIPPHIARRELKVVQKLLPYQDSDCEICEHPDSAGPGNLLCLEQQYEQVSELCTGFGQRYKSAEKVAHEVCDQMQDYLEHGAPVGRRLADQVLLPMALAGAGRFRTGPLSRHTQTQIDILKCFLPLEISVTREDGPKRVELVELGRKD
ncbi:MAG: RNA 3'-phosphate cyclase [Planctomycetota bacterium]|nr:MAG: RNA 3'-phosphate cyclase [Planctomycetota bacterium]